VQVAIQGGIRERKAVCPSCGAPVLFRGATSIVAVCDHCRATLVREGAKLEDIGRQADLLPDDTLLQRGASGQHRGEAFTLVGRIQYRYGAGLWNEWHALFQNGRSGWLSDASRDYTIAFLAPPTPVPAFEALEPGTQVPILGDRYTVTNRETAEVIAGEGELPFRFVAGWKAPVADLRGPGTRFATVDYSEEVPHVYVGERLPFDTFRFAGLRDPDRPAEPGGRAVAFKCSGCGAPIARHLATTEVIACESCGTVTDVTGTAGELVQRNERVKSAFGANSIPLGATGRWKGVDYEVVGFMRRKMKVEGEVYEWGEYLLHNVAQGYAWLSEYNGHFSFIRDTAEVPKVTAAGGGAQPVASYLGRAFRHFQKYEARVSYLVGEFPWRVKIDDAAAVDDFVAPPLILSREKTGSDLTWSLGEYVEPAALWQAFGLRFAPPKRTGTAPNQPPPLEGKTAGYWMAFAFFLAAAFLLQFLLMGFHKLKAPDPVRFAVSSASTARVTSPVFDLGGTGGLVGVRIDSNAGRSWLDVDLRLVNADTGRAWDLQRRLGMRGLGQEADRTDVDLADIRAVPPGRYALTVVARAGTPAVRPGAQSGPPTGEVRGTVQLRRPSPGWSNLVLLAAVLLVGPLVAMGRVWAFERARWAESDYPPFTASGEDEE
jgi:DNA-directed RNA polymerase subunit RPC12/RpoP